MNPAELEALTLVIKLKLEVTRVAALLDTKDARIAALESELAAKWREFAEERQECELKHAALMGCEETLRDVTGQRDRERSRREELEREVGALPARWEEAAKLSYDKQPEQAAAFRSCAFRLRAILDRSAEQPKVEPEPRRDLCDHASSAEQMHCPRCREYEPRMSVSEAHLRELREARAKVWEEVADHMQKNAYAQRLSGFHNAAEICEQVTVYFRARAAAVRRGEG